MYRVRRPNGPPYLGCRYKKCDTHLKKELCVHKSELLFKKNKAYQGKTILNYKKKSHIKLLKHRQFNLVISNITYHFQGSGYKLVLSTMGALQELFSNTLYF